MLAASVMALALSGCGNGPAQTPPSSSASSSSTASTTDAAPQVSTTTDGKNTYTEWLPSGVTQTLSEANPDAKLQKAIADYYEIPKDELAETRYYYNYVDLNNDGTKEILAVAMGPYTSGTGGDSMLWIIPNADMAVSQAFTLVNTPIIVSDKMTNGAHELIVMRAGGGAKTEYVRLVCSDGEYTSIADAEPIDDISSVTGTAIICDDLMADAASGDFFTLAN